nr:hypothetical protein [Tanacetum cinerariifolium]
MGESYVALHQRKENGRIMLESIENGPLVYPTVEEDGQIRKKKYAELIEQEQLQDDCDVQATKIILQGLSPDVYALVNHCQSAKDIWERVKLLMKGTELSYQEHESQYPQQLSSTPQKTHSSQPYSLTYEAPHHPQHFQHAYQPQISHPTPSVPQNTYHSPTISPQLQTEFPQLDSGLVVLVFLPGDDPIACLNKAMAFMSTVVASHFPSTNNQLRTSSNLRNQATIQDCRVTVQQVQGIQAKAVLMANLSSYDSDVISKDFEHTKKVFKEQVIPFINSLRVSFKDFENGLHSKLNEVKTVFNQMKAVVDQCFVDKKYFDIQKKEVSIDNDRLLDHIICQDVMNIVMHANSVLANLLPTVNKCLVNDNLKIERLEQENDHLFELLLSQDIVHICVNSLASRNDCRKMQQGYINKYNENIRLKAELAKKEQMVKKTNFDKVVLRCSRLENRNVKDKQEKDEIGSKPGKNRKRPHETFQCQPVNYCEPNPSYDSYYSGFDQFGDFHPQQYSCCENYGGPHETFQCQPTNEDYYHEQNSCYNYNSFGSDHCQPPKYTVNHPIFNAHNDFLNSQNELSIAQNTIMEQMTRLTSMCELVCQIFQKKQEEKRVEEEQAANARYWKILACCDDDDDYDSAITPILSTEETDNSLSMGDEHLDTISATKSDEVIKSSVEDLVPILSESEGIPDTMCDVHLVNNPTPLEVKDHFEIVINSNDDNSSSDDDSLYKENIEYVEASPHDSKLVSLEAAEIVTPEVKEIEDDNFREKLLNINLLIAHIEALKDNPPQSFEFLTKSSSTSLNSLLEETNTFHNSLPEFESFYFDLEEISSGSTTTDSDISLPDYKAFYFDDDHVKEISSGSPTTQSDISLSEYDSFIFDFTHEEFADELAHIISPPEYDYFYFWDLPDSGCVDVCSQLWDP